ncbi:MAG: hypothetical protein PV358_04895 [Acidimicrobiales bacterium]|nr:hypothetical protein [Acidimicrobiales bacterium]
MPNPPITVVAEASLDDVPRGMDAVRAELVVDVDDDRVQVRLREPAVAARARHDGGCAPGDEVDVVVRAADPVALRLDLEVVG